MDAEQTNDPQAQEAPTPENPPIEEPADAPETEWEALGPWDVPDEDAAGSEEASPPWRPRRSRIIRPWEALARLDAQWEDRTPIRDRERAVALALTDPADPCGYDYLGAMTGALERDVVSACRAWLGAQLAADAVALGRAYRPRVELIPAGRLWYVVRTVADVIVAVDGPGWPTPGAAARAALMRYRAELCRERERAAEAAPEPEDEKRIAHDADPDADGEPAPADAPADPGEAR